MITIPLIGTRKQILHRTYGIQIVDEYDRFFVVKKSEFEKKYLKRDDVVDNDNEYIIFEKKKRDNSYELYAISNELFTKIIKDRTSKGFSLYIPPKVFSWKNSRFYIIATKEND